VILSKFDKLQIDNPSDGSRETKLLFGIFGDAYRLSNQSRRWVRIVDVCFSACCMGGPAAYVAFNGLPISL
jgi:hypothetical protein